MGNNNNIGTVYNVGKINKDKLPSAKLIAVVRSKPLGNSSYNNNISDSAEFVKSSIKDSDGNTISNEQAEYFKDSKIRDEDGNLLACLNYLANYCQVKISRKTDVDSTIASKVKEANSWGADLVVEIHHNAGGGDGAEVFYPHDGTKSKKLAENILDGIKTTGQNSRGTKVKLTSSGADYFGILRNTTMPSVLVECAFLDSKDKEIIDTAAKRKKMGEAIAKGVLKYLGLTEKPKDDYFPSVGYFGKGDISPKLVNVCDFFAELVKGDTFGDYLEACVKVYQQKHGIGTDGKVGRKTLAAMEKEGFKK